MPAAFKIEDGGGKKTKAKVTSRGQLVTAPIDFDEVANTTVALANTAYNLYEPKPNQRFVITTILITAKKDVTTDEVVDIYESADADSTTVVNSIMQIEMLKSTARDFIGLNLLATEGAYINAKADDATTLVTMMGYYVST